MKKMSLFEKHTDVKFIKLVTAIDQRLKIYEKLLKEASEPHPKGLELVAQEFRNLKIKAWDIEKNTEVYDLVKDITEDEIKQKVGE